MAVVLPFSCVVRRALARHADAECALCEAIDAWRAARLPALRHAARIRVQSAVLTARMARGAVAQARREAALASPQGGNQGDKIAQLVRANFPMTAGKRI